MRTRQPAVAAARARPACTKRFRLWLACILTLVAAAGLAGPRTILSAQAPPPLEYQRYDVDVQLDDGGDVHVRITQQIAVRRASEQAFLEIPKDFAHDITNVAVYRVEGDRLYPAGYTLAESADAATLTWSYPRAAPGDVRQFIIDYTAAGVLWVYNDRDILRWEALRVDPAGAPIQAGSVTLRLPSYIPLDAVQTSAHGAPYSVEKRADAFVFSTQGELQGGQFFSVEADFPHGLVNAAVQDWQKAVDSRDLAVAVTRFDLDIHVKKSGILVVREQMDLAVNAGVLYNAHREIRRLYLDDITHLRVTQDDQLLPVAEPPCEPCLTLSSIPRADGWVKYDSLRDEIVIDESRTGSVRADWSAAPVYAGQTTSLAVEYVALGAVRQEPAAQSFDWQVLPDLGTTPQTATVRIYLPPGTAAHDLRVTHNLGDFAQLTPSGDYLLLEVSELAPAGEAWTLHVAMPPNTVANTVSAWQADLEGALSEQRAAQRLHEQRQLAILSVAMAAVVLLLLWAFLTWLKGGRSRLRERLGSYAGRPPSDVAPGIVAYLVDGEVRPRGLLASLLHLAALGLIEIDLRGRLAVRLLHPGEACAEDVQIPSRHTNTPNTHLLYLFNHVLLPTAACDRFTPLDALMTPLQDGLLEFYAAMASDAQAFLLLRAAKRSPWQLSPLALMLTWFAVAGAIMFATFRFQIPSILAVILVGAAFLLFFILHARRELSHGQTRANAGAQERHAWVKYRTYLADLPRTGNAAAARQALQRSFGYAVALGVEGPLLAYATRRAVKPPTWLAPAPRRATPARTQPKRPPLFRRAYAAAARSTPILRALGDSLEQANAALGDLLGAVALPEADESIRVTLRGAHGVRLMQWEPGTPAQSVAGDLLRQSLRDIRRARQDPGRATKRARAPGGSTPRMGEQGKG